MRASRAGRACKADGAAKYFEMLVDILRPRPSLGVAMATTTRRDFLETVLQLASLAIPAASAAQAPRKAGKKGLGISARNPQWAKRVADLKVHWIYNWMSNRPPELPTGVEWVPMIFRDNENREAEKSVAKVREILPNKPSAVLGFNEPDQKDQANMTVEQAIEAWPLLETLNLPLGSPAGVHADSPWMQSFMKEAAKRKYRIDFVTIHWYGGTSSVGLMAHLEKIFRLYRHPVWITEFCPADWSASKTGKNQHSQQEVLAFIKDVLPRLERASYVQRYAWFSSEPGNTPTGCSALFDGDGNLSKVGEAYAAIG